MSDKLVRAITRDGLVKAVAVSTRELTERARQIHRTTPVATAALGRTLAAASMLGNALKEDGASVTLQIKGGGPIGTVFAVAHGDCTVKGYVDNPAVDLPRTGKKLPVGAAVGKEGRLTVIKDLKLREPYVGQVNLVSGEIAEDFAMYFTASEQTPSLVSLGVLVSDERVEAAGGLIIQILPGASEAAIASIEASAGMFMDISGTMREYHLKDSVTQLLLHLEPEILSTREPRYACNCSRERIEQVLVALGARELEEMIREQHGAQVDCHFCNKRYSFQEEELKALLEAATIREGK